MSGNIESDAMPIPEAKPKFAEVPPSPVNNKKHKQKPTRKLASSSSSDSDSEDSSTNNREKGGTGTVININKAQDVHIGHRFNYANYQSCVYQKYTESDSSPININDKGPKPPEELLKSKREIEPHDLYVVAENVSRSWKKLARFLPPKNVFSNGQLKTFEDNNPRDQVEAIIEMLNAWQQQHPEYATIGVLAETLWDIGRGDISQKLNL